MAIPGGLSAQLGIALETAYGTFATPTKFVEFDSDSMALEEERIESEGLGLSDSVLHEDNWKPGQRQGLGSIPMDVKTNGFNIIWEQIFGASDAVTPGGATNTIDTSHTFADLTGTYATWQLGKPDTGGVVRPFSYLGCKVMEWELSNNINEFLKLNVTLDANDEVTTEALAAKSYASGAMALPFSGAVITANGNTFVIRSITISGNNGLEADRFGIGSATKSEPLREARQEVTVEMEVEFKDLVAYNLFKNGTMGEIVARWQSGTAIEGSFFPYVRVTMPKCRYDSPTTPPVEGPGRLFQIINAKVLKPRDGSEPITLVYRSTDGDTFPSRSPSASPSVSVSLSPSASVSLSESASPSVSVSLSPSASPSPS